MYHNYVMPDWQPLYDMMYAPSHDAQSSTQMTERHHRVLVRRVQM